VISRVLQLRKCGGAAGDATGGATGDAAGGAAGGAAGDAAGGATGDAAEGVLGLVFCYCGSGYLGDLLVLDDHLIFMDPV
jgi:hypothetical protein